MVSLTFYIVVFLVLYFLKKMENKVKFIRLWSPIVLAYIAGVLLGIFCPNQLEGIVISGMNEYIMILTLPLLLINANISSVKKSGVEFVALFAMAITVLFCSVLLIYLFFQSPQHITVIGGAAAIFSGGIANLSAYKIAVDMPESLFNLIFIGDFLTGSMYFVFFLCLVSLLYHRQSAAKVNKPTSSPLYYKELHYMLLYSAAVVALAVALSFILYQKINGTLVVIAVCGLGIIFNSWTRFNRDHCLEWGEYGLVVFCFLIGLNIKIPTSFEAVADIIYIFIALTIVNGGIYFAICRLFKIEFQKAIIIHFAAVFGPPFVVVMGRKMQKDDLIPSGLAVSSLGLGIGTFFGLGIYKLLYTMGKMP